MPITGTASDVGGMLSATSSRNTVILSSTDDVRLPYLGGVNCNLLQSPEVRWIPFYKLIRPFLQRFYFGDEWSDFCRATTSSVHIHREKVRWEADYNIYQYFYAVIIARIIDRNENRKSESAHKSVQLDLCCFSQMHEYLRFHSPGIAAPKFFCRLLMEAASIGELWIEISEYIMMA
ncbi:hypothetical protein P5673_024307 [Acropora cervicornis]|uniref:Uncharacterized protein n=1 Tax=Acropora cervicornis TaxID=6130 RepID=A0AAD9UY49_ACRCE|nr:hypothetical protein P5673_024307 [Acropora cervicornis]